MKACLLAVACAAALALPASALGAKCAPPGNSGVNQYYETIPGASCNQAPGAGGGHHGGGSLPGGTSRKLAAQGAAGKAVQALVSSSGTAPAASRSSGHKAPAGGASGNGARGVLAPPAVGANPLSALLHPILHPSSSSGLGIFLPVLLAVALALALAWTVRSVLRRRRLSS
jgi:hypothetical protein